jgi:hypothetical protein
MRAIEAIAALCGVVALALSFGGFMLIGSAGFGVSDPSVDMSRIVAQVAPPGAYLGLLLDILGSLFFVIFAARLWATLRMAEGDTAWLSAGSFGAAILAVAASFVDKTIYYAIFTHAGRGLDADLASVLFAGVFASFALFVAFVGLSIGLAGAVVLRGGGLPRWMGWLGIAVLLASVAIPAVGPVVAFPLVLIWIVAASLLLVRRPVRPV